MPPGRRIIVVSLLLAAVAAVAAFVAFASFALAMIRSLLRT